MGRAVAQVVGQTSGLPVWGDSVTPWQRHRPPPEAQSQPAAATGLREQAGTVRSET